MSNFGVIVLAAGGSTRMGRPKQLLSYRGVSLLRHAVDVAIATQFGPVVVVLGAEQEKCARELKNLAVTLAPNPRWESGLGTSIREGITILESASPLMDAALLMLHDQPLITAAMLMTLARNWNSATAPIVASSYGNSLGVPAIFPRRLFPELQALADADGAKKIILRHSEKVIPVPMPDALIDIDGPEDYEKLRESDPALRGQDRR